MWHGSLNPDTKDRSDASVDVQRYCLGGACEEQWQGFGGPERRVNHERFDDEDEDLHFQRIM